VLLGRTRTVAQIWLTSGRDNWHELHAQAKDKQRLAETSKEQQRPAKTSRPADQHASLACPPPPIHVGRAAPLPAHTQPEGAPSRPARANFTHVNLIGRISPTFQPLTVSPSLSLSLLSAQLAECRATPTRQQPVGRASLASTSLASTFSPGCPTWAQSCQCVGPICLLLFGVLRARQTVFSGRHSSSAPLCLCGAATPRRPRGQSAARRARKPALVAFSHTKVMPPPRLLVSHSNCHSSLALPRLPCRFRHIFPPRARPRPPHIRGGVAAGRGLLALGRAQAAAEWQESVADRAAD